MVVHYDIDKFIHKDDLKTFIKENFTWPWSLTHFILSEICFNCGSPTENWLSAMPSHFVLTMNREDVKYLMKSNWFWCKTCLNASVYDHYPHDECQCCNK